MSITAPDTTGNFNMLKADQKGILVFALLCVRQLWLVGNFIARAFEDSEHTVQIYRFFLKNAWQYLYIISHNLSILLQIPSCVHDVQ